MIRFLHGCKIRWYALINLLLQKKIKIFDTFDLELVVHTKEHED